MPTSTPPEPSGWTFWIGTAIGAALIPLSVVAGPGLVLLALVLFRHGGLAILAGFVALAAGIPACISILMLEFSTLMKRPLPVLGTLAVVAYNTAIFVAFEYVLGR